MISFYFYSILLADYFYCLNGGFVPTSYVCDDDNDCGDWSDEEAAGCPGACTQLQFIESTATVIRFYFFWDLTCDNNCFVGILLHPFLCSCAHPTPRPDHHAEEGHKYVKRNTTLVAIKPCRILSSARFETRFATYSLFSICRIRPRRKIGES